MPDCVCVTSDPSSLAIFVLHQCYCYWATVYLGVCCVFCKNSMSCSLLLLVVGAVYLSLFLFRAVAACAEVSVFWLLRLLERHGVYDAMVGSVAELRAIFEELIFSAEYGCLACHENQGVWLLRCLCWLWLLCLCGCACVLRGCRCLLCCCCLYVRCGGVVVRLCRVLRCWLLEMLLCAVVVCACSLGCCVVSCCVVVCWCCFW